MTAQERGLEFRFPFRGHVMADALVTDQEIAILCDVMEGVVREELRFQAGLN